MVKYALYMVTYDRGQHPLTGATKPYHWLFFISTKPETKVHMEGIAHQLRGMPGGFYYPGPETVDLKKSADLKEKLEIGEVDESQMQLVHDILKTLSIDKVESSGWNCQDWALDGLVQLRDQGLIYDYMTNEAVKTWLREI